MGITCFGKTLENKSILLDLLHKTILFIEEASIFVSEPESPAIYSN